MGRKRRVIDFHIPTMEEIRAKMEAEMQEKLSALGQSGRQEILDLLWSGLNIGQICEKKGLDVMLVGRVIVDNIKSAHYLSKEAK